MNEATRTILSRKNLGVIGFGEHLEIEFVTREARSLLRMNGSRETATTLTDLFPEVIGSEAALMDILSAGSDRWQIDAVNRVDEGGQVFYLNLLALPDDAPHKGILIIEDATESARLKQQVNQQRYEMLLFRSDPCVRNRRHIDLILGDSPPIRAIRETIARLGKVPMATVLLLGESGTGKSLAARVIHYSSMPPDAPFVEINCAALPENLIESELFGYEKGAFTHATTNRSGLFQEAENGTIFLDEIGEMPFNLQAKLLSVLETKRFRRLGSNRQIEVRARIITATNRDLKKAVAENLFREDLFYRLNVVSITLPPLRALGEDIVTIAEHFLKIHNLEFKKNVKGFTAAARQALIDHRWPGNVRELGNMIERAMIFSDSDRIDTRELVFFNPEPKMNPSQWKVPPEGIDIEAVERELIFSAVDLAGGNKSRAARLLGLTRDTLRYRLEKYAALDALSEG